MWCVPSRWHTHPRAESREPVSDALPAFEPAPAPGDVLPEAAVGPGQANRPRDVIGAKRVLSALGGYDFKVDEESSTTPGPGLFAAVKRFQGANGLNPDGVLQPGGSTLRKAAEKAFPGEGLEQRVEKAALFNPYFETKRRKAADAEFAAFKAASTTDTGNQMEGADSLDAGFETAEAPSADSVDAAGKAPEPLLAGDVDPRNDPRTHEPVDPDELRDALEFEEEGADDYDNAFNDPFDAVIARQLAGEAEEVTARLFPDVLPHNNEADAFRHAYWSYLMTRRLGSSKAKQFTDGHERNPDQPVAEQLMDLFNNAIGRLLAEDTRHRERDPTELILEALDSGVLKAEPFRSR